MLIVAALAAVLALAGCGGSGARDDMRARIDAIQAPALTDLTRESGTIDEAKPDSYGDALRRMATRADRVATDVQALGKPPGSIAKGVRQYVQEWRDLAAALRAAADALDAGDATAANAAMARYRAFVADANAAVRRINDG